MNIELLVKIITPFIIKLGEKAAESGAETIGEKSTEKILSKAQRIWDRLLPKIESKVTARNAAKEMAANPTDLDKVDLFKIALHEILEDPRNEDLRKKVASILEKIENKNHDKSKFKIVLHDNSSLGGAGDNIRVKMKITNTQK
jgi:hypothetical protein